MPTAETYRLIAYDTETGKEVFNWPNTVQVDPGRPGAGDEIEDGWKIVGVRDTSTRSLWMVDVKKIAS